MCVSESEREKWQAIRAAFLASAFSHERKTFEGMFARSPTQESCAKREEQSTSSTRSSVRKL
eukprot:9978658-Heterocapsa_arctica.AAC.1